MKKIILLLLVFMLVGCQDTDKNPNEYSADMLNIKGDVIALTEEVFDLNTGEKVIFEVFEMGYFSSANYTCQFDEKGNPIEIVEQTPEGDPVVTWISEYDDNNKLKKFTAVFEGMEEYSETVYVHDSDGNVKVVNNIVQGIQRMIYNDQVIGETKVASTFDDSGRAIRVSNNVDIDGLEGYPLYDYDEEGHISDVYWYGEGKKECHVMIKYNDKGYMSNYRYIINPFNDMQYLEFDYIYDEMENWIEQKITVDGEEMYVVKRTYEYAEE